MNADDLKAFETVVRFGVVDGAAAALKISPSDVNARLLKLEKEVGVPLFKGDTQDIYLTAAGERFLPFALKNAWLLDEAKACCSRK